MRTLQSILTEHRIPFREGGSHRHVREGWIGVDCPRCGPGTNKFHLGICLQTRQTNCWRCGGSNLGEVLGLLLDVTTPHAWALIRELPPPSRVPSEQRRARGKLTIPRGLGPLQKPHRDYLSRRGFDPDELERLWMLKGFGPIGRFAWRIWIPVLLDGEIVSWTTRSIGESDRRVPKYVNADPEKEVWPIKSLLYGWDYVRDSVVICEGPTDAWRIGPGAVATFGLAVSTEQLEKMSSVPRRIVCFDSEPIAQRTADRLALRLQSFPGATVRVELDASDPADAKREEIAKLLGTVSEIR